MNVRLSPLHDRRGHFVGRLLMLSDITRRKQAEAAEHEQRVFATALRDSASVLNSSLNLDTVLDQVLDQVARVLPYDAAAVSLVENASFARVARRRVSAGGIADWGHCGLIPDGDNSPSIRHPRYLYRS